MFTGLIETIGMVRSVERGVKSLLFGIEPKLITFKANIGDSIAINGVCLTVEKMSGKSIFLRAVEETVRTTSLSKLQSGSLVNMERALLATSRLDGHIVQGHVDGVARVTRIENRGDAQLISFQLPLELLRFVAQKGSVTLDGVSLTVVTVVGDSFTVSLIPHSMANTTLQSVRVGLELNFECDVLARYVERLMQFPSKSEPAQQVSKSEGDLMSLLERNNF